MLTQEKVNEEMYYYFGNLGLLWLLRQSRICLQCRRQGFDPWVGKIPWRKELQPTPVSLLENSMDRGAWQAKSMGSQKAGHD